MKAVSYCIIACCFIVSGSLANAEEKKEQPSIEYVSRIIVPAGEPDIFARNEVVINIKGKQLDADQYENAWLLFGDNPNIDCEDDAEDVGAIIDWNNTAIVSTLPVSLLRTKASDAKDAYFKICYVKPDLVATGGKTVKQPIDKTETKYIDQVQSIVDEAIVRFKLITRKERPDAKELAEAEVILANALYNKQLQALEKNPSKDYDVFGGVSLSNNDLRALTDASLSTDFIEKMSGQKRWLSLGATAAFMSDTSEVTPAGALRIFLEPKGYYSPRVSLTSSIAGIWNKVNHGECKDMGYIGCISNGLFMVTYTAYHVIRENFDLLVGYTASTRTAKGVDETKPHILTGFTFEFNRFIFFDAGWAWVSGGADKGRDGQLFVGLGIDPSILDWNKFLDLFGMNSKK